MPRKDRERPSHKKGRAQREDELTSAAPTNTVTTPVEASPAELEDAPVLTDRHRKYARSIIRKESRRLAEAAATGVQPKPLLPTDVCRQFLAGECEGPMVCGRAHRIPAEFVAFCDRVERASDNPASRADGEEPVAARDLQPQQAAAGSTGGGAWALRTPESPSTAAPRGLLVSLASAPHPTDTGGTDPTRDMAPLVAQLGTILGDMEPVPCPTTLDEAARSFRFVFLLIPDAATVAWAVNVACGLGADLDPSPSGCGADLWCALMDHQGTPPQSMQFVFVAVPESSICDADDGRHVAFAAVPDHASLLAKAGMDPLAARFDPILRVAARIVNTQRRPPSKADDPKVSVVALDGAYNVLPTPSLGSGTMQSGDPWEAGHAPVLPPRSVGAVAHSIATSLATLVKQSA